MMYGHEKSDHAIVAGKPTNKAEGSAAELVERRAGTEGNARSMLRIAAIALPKIVLSALLPPNREPVSQLIDGPKIRG
jgi:hypothetical protein